MREIHSIDEHKWRDKEKHDIKRVEDKRVITCHKEKNDSYNDREIQERELSQLLEEFFVRMMLFLNF